jgi:CheY-like chemotaxis protein
MSGLVANPARTRRGRGITILRKLPPARAGILIAYINLEVASWPITVIRCRKLMSAENPIVLLVEDCPVTAMLIERSVMNELPACRLLWARTVDEASQRAASLPVELFIVDIGLPDGSGLDFLWNMSVNHPVARAIVMTATPRAEHQMNSAALGVLHFLEKPLTMPSLLAKVRAALSSQTLSEAREEFRAMLKNVTPGDILQLKCLTAATTVVEFCSQAQVGWVRFEAGEIVDAEVGELRGEDALFQIVNWQRGNVAERPATEALKRTIHRSCESILMEAAQRRDEECHSFA